MPTFNFASADLASETKTWIAQTFSGAIDEETASPSVVHQQPATPTMDSSVMTMSLQTLDFNCWDYEEQELESLILQMFNKFSLLQTFNIPEQVFKCFVEGVRKGYRTNPYHNFHHGFDVMQVAFANARHLSFCRTPFHLWPAGSIAMLRWGRQQILISVGNLPRLGGVCAVLRRCGSTAPAARDPNDVCDGALR